MYHASFIPDIFPESDDTSINGVIAEDTDDTPYPWDCDGDYPEDTEPGDDDEEVEDDDE